jgi:hypothetical protein
MQRASVQMTVCLCIGSSSLVGLILRDFIRIPPKYPLREIALASTVLYHSNGDRKGPRDEGITERNSGRLYCASKGKTEVR